MALLIVINSAMPRSILRVSICNFDLLIVFEPHVQTNGKPAPVLVLFVRQVVVAFLFFGSLYRSNLSNKNKSKWGRLSICWGVHDEHSVKKNTSKYVKIDRGIAKRRLYHLSWPSSNVYDYNRAHHPHFPSQFRRRRLQDFVYL